MKKIKIFAVIMCMAVCSVFLFGCSNAKYKFDTYSDTTSKFNSIATFDATDMVYEGASDTTSTRPFAVFSKTVEATKTYAVYDILNSNWVVNFGVYTDIGELNSLQYGRLLAAKKVGENTKWGVINLFDGSTIVDFKADTQIDLNKYWTITLIANSVVETIYNFEGENVIGCTMYKVDTKAGSSKVVSERVNFVEGKTELGVTKTNTIQLFSTGVADESILGYSYSTVGDKTTIYDEKDKKVGTFVNSIEPYTVSASVSIGTKVIVQGNLKVDANSKDYDYYDGADKYLLKTMSFDYKSAKASEINLDYCIDDMNALEVNGDYFVSLIAKKIIDKQLGSEKSYIANDSLKDLTETLAFFSNDSVIYTTSSGNLFDVENEVIYTKDFEIFSYLGVRGFNDNFVVNESDSNQYTIFSFDGVLQKYIVDSTFCSMGLDYVIFSETVDGVISYYSYDLNNNFTKTLITSVGGDSSSELIGGLNELNTTNVFVYKNVVDSNNKLHIMCGSTELSNMGFTTDASIVFAGSKTILLKVDNTMVIVK